MTKMTKGEAGKVSALVHATVRAVTSSAVRVGARYSLVTSQATSGVHQPANKIK
jgi:hypothetical protein